MNNKGNEISGILTHKKAKTVPAGWQQGNDPLAGEWLKLLQVFCILSQSKLILNFLCNGTRPAD